MNYPHVGKHYTEIVGDDDIDIPDSHIQLTSIMRNNFCGWFGHDTDDDWVAEKMKRCEEFYPLIAHKMPYKWGDPRLAIGYLPLGILETTLSNHSVNKMIKYSSKTINNWTLH